MIRYIHIGDQICDDADDFAFYNTVDDRFLFPETGPVFSSASDFINEETTNSPYFARCMGMLNVYRKHETSGGT